MRYKWYHGNKNAPKIEVKAILFRNFAVEKYPIFS